LRYLATDGTICARIHEISLNNFGTRIVKMAVELIKLIPSLLWFGLVVSVIIIFYRPIKNELLPNISSLKAGGVEFSFVRASIDAALELAEKSPQWKVEVSLQDKEYALNRAKNHLRVLKNAQILWVDDHPENNLNERRMFRQLNVETDIAKSTEEALEVLENASYDLIISDIARGENSMEGLEFLERFKKKNTTTPVVFYIGVIEKDKGVPPGAFGITNRPDELLHLTLDALERRRY
jgi:CheY-like chemotaxis protein